jgi:hypothetical protein
VGDRHPRRPAVDATGVNPMIWLAGNQTVQFSYLEGYREPNAPFGWVLGR